MSRTTLSVLFTLACFANAARAEPITLANNPVEIRLFQIAPRTARLDIIPLSPLPHDGPAPAPGASILLPVDQAEKFKTRVAAELPTRPTPIGNLTVSFKPDPLSVEFHTAAGRLVQRLDFRNADGSFSFDTPGPTFGLGAGRQQFDRRGFYYDFQNGQNQFLATHGATVPVPFLIGLNPGTRPDESPQLWSMFVHAPPPLTDNVRDNNAAWGHFDLRGDGAGPAPIPARGGRGTPAQNVNSREPPATLPTRGRYIPRAVSTGLVPMTIIVAAPTTPAEAQQEYTRLVGNPVMPPKWVLGYMQSHRSLASAEEVMAVAKRFRDDKLPIDTLIYLGTGYTNATQPDRPLGGWNTGHGSLTFNPLIFPDPQKALDQLHAMNYKIILHKNAPPPNLHGTIKDPAAPGDRAAVANDWPTHTPLVKMGVDAWWPDDGDDLPVQNRLDRIRMYFDGMLRDKPDERPWSLDRNGYAGVAKYGGWNWSGDVQSTWATLKHHIAIGLNSSVSLSPWWGTDIGGFNGAAEYSGELYVRWFQFGAFNPLFRSHGRNWHLHTPWGWNAGTTGPNETTQPQNANLNDPRIEPACREALDLRYALLPYNYSIAREACDTGMPMMRPLWFYHAGDKEAVSLGDEYLWGPNLLFAPVVERGATTRRLYLPKGDWYDWTTGKRESGGKWIERPVDLTTIPLYAKAGAIVPVDPVRQYTSEPVTAPTTLNIFPGADSTFVLYDDDGHSQKYQDGGDDQTQWIRCVWNDKTRTLALEPATPAATRFYGGPENPGPRLAWPRGFKRSFQVELIGQPGVKRIEYAGEKLELRMN